MNEIRETRELKQETSGDIHSRTKAFENAVMPREVVKIKTINEDLRGKTYPGTDVEFVKKTITCDGKRIEGVFPKFKSKADVYLPKELRKSSDAKQFHYCSNELKHRIKENPDMRKEFTPRQLKQIESGAPRISNCTWHHNEVSGKMQLVDSKQHEMVRHTGGRYTWGGGTAAR